MPISKLSQRALASVLLAWAVVATAPGAAAQQPPPARPPPATPARPAPPPSPPSVDASRAGTATVLRGGKPVGLGLVLGADGRVLVSRASLGGNRKNLALQFADGSSVPATVGHEDAQADLALLTPERVSWTRGLTPSSAVVTGASRLTYLALTTTGPVPLAVGGKRATALHLPGVQQTALGSPVLDESGAAVGLVVLSCDPPEGKTRCVPTSPRLAPVPVLRAFLRAIGSAPAAPVVAAPRLPPAPYLGVRGERAIGTHARGVRVVEVAPASPAAAAKIAGGPDGDLVLAVAGEPVTSAEELTAALGKHAVGKRVSITLFATRGGYRQVDVILGRTPAGAVGAPPQTPPQTAPGARPATPRPPAAPGAQPPRTPTDGAPKDFDSRR